MAARFSEAGAWRFWPHPHAGHEKIDADTHVDSHDDVLSDAGSTPAASTTLSFLGNLRIPDFFEPRFPYVSPERVHPEAESAAVSTVATDACSASSSTDPCVRLTPESVSAPPLSSRDDYRRCAEECERQVSRLLASRRLSINANAGRTDGPFI